MIMLSFFSSIILLLSGRLKNYNSAILILCLVLISLNIFTDNFTFLKNKINPIYALNIKDNLLGKIDEDIFTKS